MHCHAYQVIDANTDFERTWDEPDYGIFTVNITITFTTGSRYAFNLPSVFNTITNADGTIAIIPSDSFSGASASRRRRSTLQRLAAGHASRRSLLGYAEDAIDHDEDEELSHVSSSSSSNVAIAHAWAERATAPTPPLGNSMSSAQYALLSAGLSGEETSAAWQRLSAWHDDASDAMVVSEPSTAVKWHDLHGASATAAHGGQRNQKQHTGVLQAPLGKLYDWVTVDLQAASGGQLQSVYGLPASLRIQLLPSEASQASAMEAQLQQLQDLGESEEVEWQHPAHIPEGSFRSSHVHHQQAGSNATARSSPVLTWAARRSLVAGPPPATITPVHDLASHEDEHMKSEGRQQQQVLGGSTSSRRFTAAGMSAAPAGLTTGVTSLLPSLSDLYEQTLRTHGVMQQQDLQQHLQQHLHAATVEEHAVTMTSTPHAPVSRRRMSLAATTAATDNSTFTAAAATNGTERRDTLADAYERVLRNSFMPRYDSIHSRLKQVGAAARASA